MNDDLRNIFGVDETPPPAEFVALGRLSLLVGETNVRRITWCGSELVRSIDYPIRDGEWGTLATRTLDSSTETGADTYRYNRGFEIENGSVVGRFELLAEARGRLRVGLELTIRRDVRLCRAGFTLLHPIAGLAGGPLTIIGPNGEIAASEFPLLIAPSQPATRIAGMRYGVDAAAVDIAMAGEVFEMEDQRNWSDASYKTYGMTSSFPFAYEARAGERVKQELTLAFSGAAQPAAAWGRASLRFEPSAEGERFPELALAVEPGWAADPAAKLPPLDRLRRLVRLDLRQPLDPAFLRNVAVGLLDLELVVSDEREEMTGQLQALRVALAEIGIAPTHVMALPAAYLKSYQPDGQWPTGATPADAIVAARQAFPAARIGGGVLTNFTELNRCRPNPNGIDYLTHGSAAIVHAADDLSVFQTLEALPQIFRSAHALAPTKPYRLGLTTIGARSNPYGSALASNPERRRRTMTDMDPRAGGLFGAAWLVGIAAATEGAGVDLLTLAGAGGPFGLGATALSPSFHVLRRLATMQGQPRLHPRVVEPDIHMVAVSSGKGAVALVANGSAAPRRLEWPGIERLAVLDAGVVPAAATDPDWVESALAPHVGPLVLPPYAVAFVELDALPGGPV